MATLTSPQRRGSLFTERRRPFPDIAMFVLMTVLLALGVVMVYSATFVRLEADFGDPGIAMRRQLVFAAVTLVVFVVISMIDYRVYRNALPFMFAAVLIGLIVVLFMPERSGASRWIPIGTYFQLQPSEFAKVGILVVLAGVLAPAREEGMKWSRLVAGLAVAAIPSMLIFRQPDLGTMLVVPFIAIGMLFAAGTTFRQILVLLGAGIAGTFIVWERGLKAYQIARVTGFLDQNADLQGANYNLRQSQIAIGSGQLTGRGLFEGTQTKLNFVPAQTTDFIFTTIGEQLGFIGGSIVLMIYMFLLWRILMIANGASDRFGSLIAVGVATFLAFHIFINIGMNIGVAPVTGLPLPFLSAGGSAMISMGASLGLVNSVWRGRSPVPGREYIQNI
jgi:rod shape determining protein RodA